MFRYLFLPLIFSFLLFANQVAGTCPCDGASALAYEGCFCFLKWINVLKSQGPRDGKAIALGVFCPQLPGVFPTELREYCSAYITSNNLEVLNALRGIDAYLRLCKNDNDGIVNELTDGSEFLHRLYIILVVAILYETSTSILLNEWGLQTSRS
ncbi:unnamed protein product [Agarophyton chilense]